MKVELKPGKYVVAVSGGVDSMVLLNKLSKIPELELVVAHFNHGIRADSDKDEALVVATAERYSLPFAIGKGHLGAKASEELARQARYAFLAEVQEDFEASSIVTGHHQDDLIETALINLLRGSGSKGLTAIADNEKISRPLLNTPKSEIFAYAKVHGIIWREDPTNQSPDYLRNYIRLKLLPQLNLRQRQGLLGNIRKTAAAHKELTPLLENLSGYVRSQDHISRSRFNRLPVDLGRELLVYWLRHEGYKQFDRKIIDRLLLVIKTSRAGTLHPVYKDLSLKVDNKTAWFEHNAQPLL